LTCTADEIVEVIEKLPDNFKNACLNCGIMLNLLLLYDDQIQKTFTYIAYVLQQANPQRE